MTVLEAIVATASRYPTVPLALLLALAEHESNFEQCATNQAGADAQRGGAWGLFQVTLKTAEAYVGKLDKPELLLDAVVNTDVACRIIEADLVRFTGHLDDVICAYNSGKPRRRAPDVTVFKYLPSVKAKYLRYKRLIDERVKSIVNGKQVAASC